MNIRLLELWNFRSYEKLSLPLSPGISLFTGANGQGKTNIIESIYLLCTGRSHRTNTEQDMILSSSPWARARVETVRRDGVHTVDMVMQRGQKKRILVNGLAISRVSEMLGHVSGVIFSPEDLDLIKEGPVKRRRFMDIELSQVSRTYFHQLSDYNKVLEQRNSLLKEGGKAGDLEVWDTLLVQRAVPVIKARRAFCQRLLPLAKENHAYLSSGKETLECLYHGCVKEADDPQIGDELFSALEKNRDRDLKFRFTTVGPHKDDLLIRLGDMDLRHFGSQGQQRTAALALILSEVTMMREDLGENPVLLLDDVLSELDPTRQKLLLQRLEGVQTLVTNAQPVSCFDSMAVERYKVEKSRVWKR